MSEMDRYLGRIYGSLTEEPEMTNDERVKVLADKLSQAYLSISPGRGSMATIWQHTAQAILADPRAHVDALCAAGVLKVGFTHDSYWVVRPEPPKLCRNCREPVEPWTFNESSIRPGPGWRHLNGQRACQVLAEVDE